jgi:hypothetical protein
MNDPEYTHPPPLEPTRKKRKYTRQKARIPIIPPEHRPAPKLVTTPHVEPPEGTVREHEFEGLTPTHMGACCDRCFEARCVITGKPYCGHPHKSGIQAVSQSDRVVKDRYARAVLYLKHLREKQSA